MRTYLARYADGRTRTLWAMSHEQAAKQARFYGVPEGVELVEWFKGTRHRWKVAG